MTNYRDSTRLCHVILKGVVLWYLCVTSAQANNIQELLNGITLKNTRVIYPHSATNGVTYSVTNNTAIPIYYRLVLYRGKIRSSQRQTVNMQMKRKLKVVPHLLRYHH